MFWMNYSIGLEIPYCKRCEGSIIPLDHIPFDDSERFIVGYILVCNFFAGWYWLIERGLGKLRSIHGRSVAMRVTGHRVELVGDLYLGYARLVRFGLVHDNRAGGRFFRLRPSKEDGWSALWVRTPR